MSNDCGCGGSVRALAASAGIQFSDLHAEAFRFRDKLGPDRKKAYDECIRQLVRGGAVSEMEQRALLELGKRGFAVGSDAEFKKFVPYAQALHKRLLTDRNTSPVALAIAGAIASYAVPSTSKPTRHGRVLANNHNIRCVTSCSVWPVGRSAVCG